MASAFLIIVDEILGSLDDVGTMTGVASGVPLDDSSECITFMNLLPYSGSLAPYPAVMVEPASSGDQAKLAASTSVFPSVSINLTRVGSSRVEINKSQIDFV